MLAKVGVVFFFVLLVIDTTMSTNASHHLTNWSDIQLSSSTVLFTSFQVHAQHVLTIISHHSSGWHTSLEPEL